MTKQKWYVPGKGKEAVMSATITSSSARTPMTRMAFGCAVSSSPCALHVYSAMSGRDMLAHGSETAQLVCD